ncbi:MAG: S1 RNA-binding domain-containing protein [Kiritimatiellae bacterium]|nr:S1 RNA-binding domain-containing protein [Kiritimatiellia bacterium]
MITLNTSATASEITFTPGMVITATVKSMNACGVFVETLDEKIAGMIKASCFGKTADERRCAVMQYQPGQQVKVKVCAYYEAARQLVLAFASSATAMVKHYKKVKHSKPQKQLLAPGTLVVVDAANVVGLAQKFALEFSAWDVLSSVGCRPY